MKTRFHRFQARALCAVALALESGKLIAADPTFSDANWTSMGGIPGANEEVYATVMDGSGNLYVGGRFTIIGNVFANRVARWDGMNWSPLGTGVGSGGYSFFYVYALAISGSNVYVGGDFKTAGGIAATNIAKWDGSKWSPLGTGTDTPVRALAVSGGDLYVGGWFREAGGVPARCIAKWNGSTWSALGTGIDGDSPSVLSLAVSGGTVYAGGRFSVAGGNPATNIAKWNGNSWSALGSGMNHWFGVNTYVNALAVSGANVYAGGDFSSAGGNEAYMVARWNGSSWSALNTNRYFYSQVSALAISGSDLYAGGWFTTANGLSAERIAKWNGSTWSTLGSGMNSAVLGLAARGSNVYAGGFFSTAGGRAFRNLAHWNGTNWSALGSVALNSNVSSVTISGTNVYLGGSFRNAGGVDAGHVVKWAENRWMALGAGMAFPVSALAVSGSEVYASSPVVGFQNANGDPYTDIRKWDGTNWSALGSIIGTAPVLAISYTNLYAAGHSPIRSQACISCAIGCETCHTCNRSECEQRCAQQEFCQIAPITLARWDGSGWSPWAGYEPVYSMAVHGSNIYVGGSLDYRSPNIARWNGTAWSPMGRGFNTHVYALAISGTNLYAGGAFTRATNTAGTVVPANYVAQWNGSNWSALGSGLNGEVYALAIARGSLYVGGKFTLAGGNPANFIARWTGSAWLPLGTGVNGPVRALAVSGDYLFVGGDFTAVGGKVSAYIARFFLGDQPTLSISRSGSELRLRWSAEAEGFALEQAASLGSSESWTVLYTNVTDDGIKKSITIPATNTAQFFRLRRP